MINVNNKILSGFVLGLCLLVPGFARSEEDPNSFAGKLEMSGYQLKPYAGFEKKWKLVTVRYRKDNGEIRYIYANDLAWKSLKKGDTDYPDGAVFAKIGLATQDDPAFASSLVPSGARRYQLMVRNKKKHADTDGWGYALFDANGRTFPGEPKMAVRACAACHHLVPERGYVFAQIAELSPFVTPGKEALKGSKKIEFTTVQVSSLVPAIAKYLPAKTKEVRLMQGGLVKNAFQGTLDEIRPSLANEVLASSLPAILVSENNEMFSLVFEGSDKKGCPAANEVGLVGIHSLDLKTDRVFTLNFCHKQKLGQ